MLSDFWCVFLLVLPWLSLLLNTNAPPPLSEIHVPTHREAQSLRCPTCKVPKRHLDHKANLEGAGLSQALIAGSVNKCVCLRVRPCLAAVVASHLVVSELLMWRHLQLQCGETITRERPKQYSQTVYFVLHEMHHIQVFPSTSKSSAASRCKQLSRCSVLLLSNANMFSSNRLG